jgi:hypothetical protein
MDFWEREARLEVGDAGSTGKSWSGLRLAFKVEKDDNPAPDEGTISIWNLSQESREGIVKGQLARLFAGYRDTPQPCIIQGDIRKVSHKKDGLDVVTELTVADGGIVYQTARLSRTWRGPVGARTILADVAASMGLGIAALPVDLPDIQFLRGFSALGPARETLDTIAKTTGARWTIQDGEIVFTRNRKATTETAFILSPDSGLVGSPERMEDGTVTATCLLNGLIRPRRKVEIQSAETNGFFIVKKVTHDGDTFGQNYYTTIEGMEWQA